MTAYEQLNLELERAGVPVNVRTFIGETKTPMDTLVNSKVSSKPYLKILLAHINKLTDGELEMVIRAISEKGNKEASSYLIDILENPEKASQNLLWAVANALYVIDNKSTYERIIELSKKQELGIGRQMLLGVIGKIKSDECYNILITSLNDPKVKGHAIEALGKLGDKRAIAILENIEVSKGKYEFKAKQTALKRLRK